MTFSRMVGYSLEAAKELEKEGISVEVINLRCVTILLSFFGLGCVWLRLGRPTPPASLHIN